MTGWENMYSLITNDIQMSSIVAIALLVIGYVCAQTSRNCVYSYHIGRNRDSAAGRFALLSLGLYITAGITLATIGYHAIENNKNSGLMTVNVTNNVTTEIQNPLTEWFDEIYEECELLGN